MKAEHGLPLRWRWVIAHFIVVLIAALYGGAAPILLAVTLPLALELSSFRLQPLYPAWLLATLSGAVALWLRAGGFHPAYEAFPALLMAIGGIPFLFGSSRAKPYLVALTVEIWLVAYLSSGHGGGDTMIEWLRLRGLTPERADSVTHVFRKTVHFTFYGTVGWTVLRAMEGPGLEAVRTALLVVLALAAFDELRQSGYANRTGSAWDVLLDLSGAVVFVGLSEWRRQKKR